MLNGNTKREGIIKYFWLTHQYIEKNLYSATQDSLCYFLVIKHHKETNGDYVRFLSMQLRGTFKYCDSLLMYHCIWINTWSK